jgi:four helix bundle protein
MKESIVKNKSYDFALRITMAHKHLTQEQRDFIISKEVLRCGTSIGVFLGDAERTKSTVDFIHKIHSAQKAAAETEYWLRLLIDSDYVEDKSFNSIYSDCAELVKLLTEIVETTENK